MIRLVLLKQFLNLQYVNYRGCNRFAASEVCVWLGIACIVLAILMAVVVLLANEDADPFHIATPTDLKKYTICAKQYFTPRTSDTSEKFSRLSWFALKD